MTDLGNLKNTTRPHKKVVRVGRGIGSGVGKTSGRGQDGAGSRSGYKRRFGYEGGQNPLYRKLPCRGFSNARFKKEIKIVNLKQIENVYNDGDTVNADTLNSRGLLSGCKAKIKLLGTGELTKKVKIEVDVISEGAREKLEKANIAFTVKSDKPSE